MAGVRVIDPESQQEIEVDSKEATQGWLQGRYVLPEKRVRVGRGMETGYVDAEKLNDAVGEGWDIISDEDARSRTLQREESDIASQALGAAESFASGATLGGSRLVEEALGVDPERMRARESEAAELAGSLAGIVGTGGTGLAAKAGVAAGKGLVARGVGAAAKGLATPSRLATQAGAVAERALAKGLTRAPGVVQKVVPIAGRGAVEGFAFGAGAEIDESVLGEREITAERLMASGLLGAALGGIGEVGLRAALPAIVGSTAKVSQKAMQKTLGAVTGGDGSSGLAKAISKMQAPVSGAPIDALERQWQGVLSGDSKTLRALDQTKDVTEGVAGQISESFGKIRSLSKELGQANLGDAKLRRVDELLPRNADIIAPRASAAKLQETIGRLDEMVELNARRGYKSFVAKDLDDAVNLANKAMEEMIESPSAAGSFRSLERLKRSVDDVIQRRGGRKGLSMKTPEVQDTVNALIEINDGIRNHLMDRAIWGKAADLQADINGAISNRFRAVDGSDSLVARMLKGVDTEIAPDKALSVARKVKRDARGDRVSSDIDDVLDAEIGYFEALQKHYDLPPEMAKRIDEAKLERDKLRRVLEDKADVIDAADDLQKIRAAEGASSPSITAMSTLGPTVGGAIGASVGGLPGFALGVMAGSVTRPYSALRTMAAMRQMAERVQLRTSGAVARFLGKKARQAGRVGTRAAVRAAAREPARREGDKQKRHRELRQMLVRVAQNPEAMEQSLPPDIHTMRSVAPAMADAVSEKSMKAMHYLLDRAPPVFAPAWANPEDARVDPFELERWMRMVAVVEDPVVALDRLGDRTITKEEVDTLREVYPEIYKDAQSQILEEVGRMVDNGERIAFADRVQLNTLFGVDLDVSGQAVAMAAQGAEANTDSQPQPSQQQQGRSKTTHDIDTTNLGTAVDEIEKPLSAKYG